MDIVKNKLALLKSKQVQKSQLQGTGQSLTVHASTSNPPKYLSEIGSESDVQKIPIA
jgi:hypothetical protein